MRRIIFCAFLAFGIVAENVQCKQIEAKTDAPIIGILTQEIVWPKNKHWQNIYESYIAASYVKFVEGGGARPVPIWINRSRTYYEDMMSKVNGILLPGGGVWFDDSNGYADAGVHIYDIAKQMNDNGIYFPLFGICLGFELLLYASNSEREYRTVCSSSKQKNTLDFTEGNDDWVGRFRDSRLYGETPPELINILVNEEVASNFHVYCVTKQDLTDFGLDKSWKDLSYSSDLNGLEFISSVEHRRYPFYGLQFHPEKNIYEWIPNLNMPHSKGAIAIGQYFQAFFINECRMNANQFSSVEEENQALIYNFPITFAARHNLSIEQVYFFKSNISYPQADDHLMTFDNVNIVEMAYMLPPE